MRSEGYDALEATNGDEAYAADSCSLRYSQKPSRLPDSSLRFAVVEND
jgi:hypothetical protein